MNKCESVFVWWFRREVLRILLSITWFFKGNKFFTYVCWHSSKKPTNRFKYLYYTSVVMTIRRSFFATIEWGDDSGGDDGREKVNINSGEREKEKKSRELWWKICSLHVGVSIFFLFVSRNILNAPHIQTMVLHGIVLTLRTAFAASVFTPSISVRFLTAATAEASLISMSPSCTRFIWAAFEVSLKNKINQFLRICIHDHIL